MVVSSKVKKSTRSVKETSNRFSDHAVHIIESKPTGIDLWLMRLFNSVRVFLRYGLVFLGGGVLTLCIVSITTVLFYSRVVAYHADVPITQLLGLALTSKTTSITQTQGRKNILILGIDRLGNRDALTVLTDTILVLSMGINDSKIKTFSLPRDLYVASHSAKINSLLEKGTQLSPNQPTQIIEQTVEDITGMNIHHAIVLDITTVGRLIDAFGGLDIAIDRSFIDYQFPRTDVDVRVEQDPDKLYEMVAFSQGTEHMNGERALKFIRSRKSVDLIEGTDEGRVRRQQKVISALLNELKDPMLARNPEQIGKLLKLYKQHFESALPLPEVVALGRSMVSRRQFPTFESYQFPMQERNTVGVFFHPERHNSGAWVYLPVDPTYNQLKNLVHFWIKE